MWTIIPILGSLVSPFVSGIPERSEWQMDGCKCVVVIASAILYSLDQAKKNMLPADSMLCVCNPVQITWHEHWWKWNAEILMRQCVICDCIMLRDARLNLSLAPGDKITSTLQWHLVAAEPNQQLCDAQIQELLRSSVCACVSGCIRLFIIVSMKPTTLHKTSGRQLKRWWQWLLHSIDIITVLITHCVFQAILGWVVQKAG